MIIDPHAHISPESFIEDVRKKRFGKAVAIVKGKPWEFLITPSYRHDFASAAIGDLFRFDFTINAFFARAEASRWITKRHAFRIGTEFIAGVGIINAQAPPIPTE